MQMHTLFQLFWAEIRLRELTLQWEEEQPTAGTVAEKAIPHTCIHHYGKGLLGGHYGEWRCWAKGRGTNNHVNLSKIGIEPGRMQKNYKNKKVCILTGIVSQAAPSTRCALSVTPSLTAVGLAERAGLPPLQSQPYSGRERLAPGGADSQRSHGLPFRLAFEGPVA